MPAIETTTLRAKCVVVGEPGVGKTSILQMFQSDGVHFPTSYQFTSGAEILMKSLNITTSNLAIDFQLYDCSGKDVYNNIVQKYWDNANMVAVVFDVSNPGTLDVAGQWLERVKQHNAASNSNLLSILIGNKIDLAKRRMVSEESGEAAAIHMKFNCGYVSVSAKDFENINKPFYTLAENYKKHFDTKILMLRDLYK